MKSQRIVRFDLELQLEAYYFKGLEQQSPNHFHDYYVIGLIDNGQRYLTCREVDYVINPNDLILFNPYDNHACKQVGDSPLLIAAYISPEVRCKNIILRSLNRSLFCLFSIQWLRNIQTPTYSENFIK